MAKVVKVIELMSQSPKSWEDAAQGAVEEAAKTLRNVRSLYIKEFTAEVDDGKVTNYRINAKVTLTSSVNEAVKRDPQFDGSV
jgi:dodecin